MKLEVQTLVDMGLEEGIAPSRYFFEWHRFARWSYEACLAVGLQPHHRFLDVGCGAMRAGIEILPYLHDGGYHGMDAYEPYLRLARRLVERIGLDRSFQLVQSRDFAFETMGGDFDFALCQSVFTHLSLHEVERCIERLQQVMRPGGRLLFTHNTRSWARGDLYDQVLPMIHSGQSVEWLEKLARRRGLRFEPQPLEHPTQRTGLLVF